MADASFTIAAKLDNKEFIQDSRQMLDAIKSLKQTTAEAGRNMAQSSDGYVTAMRNGIQASKEVNAEMQKLEGQADELRRRLKEAADQRIATEDYAKLTKEIEHVNAAIEKMQARQQRAVALGEPVDSKRMQAMDYDIDQLEQKYEKLIDQQKQLDMFMDNSKAGADTREYAAMSAALKKVETQLAELNRLKNSAFGELPRNSWEEMIAVGDYRIKQLATGIANFARIGVSAIARVASFMGHLAASAGRTALALAKMAGGAVLSFLRKLAVSAKNAFVQLAKLAGNAIATGIKKLGALAATAGKKILSLGKNARKSGAGFQFSFKNILRYGLGIRSLFVLFNRLRRAMVESLGNMAKIDQPTNKAISSIVTALNQLKNSLGSAFQPIVTAVAPYLTQLMNMLSAAMTKIAEFFALLTGQKYILKATAVQTDYAKSLDKTAKSAGGAAKEMKNQLAAFDSLNILSDSSGSGGGGGSSSDTEDPSKMFQKIPVASMVTDFLKELRDAFNAGDYFSVGTIIAGKLNQAIGNLNRLIRWDNVGDTISHYVDIVAGAFNGLIDPEKGINFALIGDTIGQGINTIVNTFNRLLDPQTGINFAGLGTNIGLGVMGLVTAVDWDNVGDLFGKRINAVVDVIKNGFLAIDFKLMGADLALGLGHMRRTIDWDGIGDAFGLALSGALEFLVTAAAEFDWKEAAEQLTQAIKRFIAKVKRTMKELQPQFNTIGDKIGDALNAMIAGIPWGHIGELAASYFGMIFAIIKRAMMKFDFGAAGKAFADTVNSFFSNEQMWQDVGDAANEAFKGVIEWVKVFLIDFDAKQAGRDVGIALGKIDWDGIASGLWTNIKLAFSKAIDFAKAMLGTEKKYDPTTGMFYFDTNDKSLGYNLGKRVVGIITGIDWKQFASDLSTAAQKLFTEFTEFFRSLGEKQENGKNGLTNAIENFISGIEWGKIAQSIIDAAWTFFKMVGETLGQLLWDGFLHLFGQEAKTTFSRASEMLESAETIEDVANAMGSIGEYGAETYFQSMLDTMTDESGRAKDEYLGFMSYVFEDDKPYYLGTETMMSFFSAMDQVIKDKNGNIKKEFRDNLVAILGEENVKAYENGSIDMKAWFAGFNNAGKQEEGPAKTALVNIFAALAQGVKDELEISSPSKLSARYGKWFVQGFGNGVDDEENATANSVQDAFKSITDIALVMAGFAIAVGVGMAAVKLAFTTSLDAIKKDFDNSWKEIGTSTNTALTTLKGNVGTNMTSVQTTFSTKLSSILSSIRSSASQMAQAIRVQANSASSAVSSAFNSMYSTMSSNSASMESMISSRFWNMADTMASSLINAGWAIANQNWYGIGSNIVDGIYYGIYGGWNWLNNVVYNLASSLIRSAKNALGIRSPSRVFRDEVGKMVGMGMAEGIDDSEDTVLTNISNMGDAMARQMSAVASSVTFRTPAMALGNIMPYSVSATVSSDSASDALVGAVTASNDDLASVVMQAVNNATSAIVSAIQRAGGSGGASMSVDSIIDEINRRAKAQGHSPIMI